MATPEVIIAHPVRTPIGDYNGTLKKSPATELGANVVRAAVQRSCISADGIDAVVMGNVIQAGNRMNPARQAAVHGGIPVTSPAMTVNRVCGSGAQAIVTAAQEIQLGQSNVMIAGGMENMDRAPYLVDGGRWGYRMGPAEMHDSMLRDGLNDAFSGEHSGWHTEDLVTKFQVSREEQDRCAERSQKRFAEAQASGGFQDEMSPVSVKGRKGHEIFDKDEANRPATTLDMMSKLRPAFRTDGTITAGNAPGLNSGAAAMIVANRNIAEKMDVEPFARLVSYGVAAVEPGFFGLGPIRAVHRAFERAGWTTSDLERVEINEAFAAISLIVAKQLGLPEDIVNVDGGAIAHGHPVGATGAVLTVRLLHAMKAAGQRRGIVT
jgi:acetyl-CoA C-acetyltransferase